MNYIFDVDGTLTPARKQIDPYFKEFILKFFKTHHCYLASGSDFEKIKWQVEELTLDAQGVFGCSGNEYYENDQLIYSNDWQVPFELETKLTELLLTSTYDKRHGNHIEKRIGAINFSICGRDATHEQRQEYYLWDKERQERQKFTAELSKSFPEVSFVVGGEISIDIYPKGKSKQQIVNHVALPITFYGDKIFPGGNDFDLVEALVELNCNSIQVNNWLDTYTCLISI